MVKNDNEPRLNHEEFFELTGHELTGRLDGVSVHKFDDKIIAIIEMLEEENSKNMWNAGDVMYDLKKVEKNFQDFIRNIYPEDDIPVDLPEITEDLLTKQWGIDLPGTFGGFEYFLALEDEKPILYLKAFSRMDLDLDRVAIVDDESFKWIENVDYEEKLKEHGLR